MPVPDIGLDTITAFLDADQKHIVNFDGEPTEVITGSGVVWMVMCSPSEKYAPFRRWALDAVATILRTGNYLPAEAPPKVVQSVANLIQGKNS